MSFVDDNSSCSTNWETKRLAASGGQASAHTGRNRLDGSTAFIKILNRQKDPERRSRFRREAAAYETCSHPGIPKLVQSNTHRHADPDCNLYIATEFIVGPTLSEQIGKCPIRLDKAAPLILGLLGILEYCHAQEWVHRDIKPDNIILREGDFASPVLLDFGLAYKPDAEDKFATDLEQEVGNRFLRLPELAPLSPMKQDVRSDIAFAGGVLFYCLTARAPSVLLDPDQKMPHQRSESRDLLIQASGAAFYGLAHLFDRCFDQRPSLRFLSAQAMRAKLLEVVQSMSEKPIGTVDDDMKAINEFIDSQSQRQAADRHAMFWQAIDKIAAAHALIGKTILKTFLCVHTGTQVKPEYGSVIRGFTRADADKGYMPEFKVTLGGDEIVITADGVALYRTEASAPFYGEQFESALQELYIRGVRTLI